MNKPSKTLTRYAITYSIVFFIPFFIFIYFINTSILTVFQEQILKANTDNLAKIREQIDGKLSEMDRIVLSISQNPRLTPYFIRMNYYKASEGMTDLRSYKYGNDFIHDIAYVIKGDNRVYTAMQSSELEFFFQNLYPFENWPLEEIINDINNINNPVLRPADKISSVSVNSGEYIVYMKPIGGYNSYAAILFIINNENMRKALESTLKDYNENVLIIDKEGDVISSLNNKSWLNAKNAGEIIDLQHPMNIIPLKYENEEYLITHLKSNIMNLTFLSVVKNESILKKITELKLNVTYIMVLVFLLGLSAICIMVYLNYTPVRKLKKTIQDRFLINIKGKNEFQEFSDAVIEIAEKNQHLSENSANYRSLLRKHALKVILQGEYSSSGNYTELVPELLDMNAGKKAFVVMITYINKEDKSEFNSAADEIYKLIPENVDICYSEIIKRKFIVFILSVKLEAKDIFEDKIKILPNSLESSFRCYVTTSSSSFYNDILYTGHAYSEACTAIEAALAEDIEKNGYNVNTDSLFEGLESGYPYKLINNIYIYISQGNCALLEITLGQLDVIMKNIDLPPLFNRCVLFDAINASIRAVANADTDIKSYKESFNNILNILDKDTNESMTDLFGRFVQVSRDICKKISSFLQKKNELMKKITDYIELHYKKYDFSVENMAESIGMTVSHLSRVFKDNKNITITEYVWDMRLNKAIEMLLGTDLPVKSISAEVGYNDVSHFTQKFRQKTGITPGEYRLKNKFKAAK